MFRRKLEVKMVKDNEEPLYVAPPVIPVQEVLEGAATLMFVYFGLSTLRGAITHVIVTKVK